MFECPLKNQTNKQTKLGQETWKEKSFPFPSLNSDSIRYFWELFQYFVLTTWAGLSSCSFIICWLSGICESESSHMKNMLTEQIDDCAKNSKHRELAVSSRSVSLLFLFQKLVTKALPFWLSPFIWDNALLVVVTGKNDLLNSVTMEWLQNYSAGQCAMC